uniref:Uncharacterized protein n=1 Tax=Panagrolaimus davidi TaxID=227884 RepID=A0A914QUC2_9BILA
MTKKPKEVDENMILGSERFELRRNKSGKENGGLILLIENDNLHCYKYYFDKSDQKYKCSKCREKHVTVTATLHEKEENGEKYLALGKNQHICEPVKYEPEKEVVVDSNNFMIFDQNDDTKPTRLVLFTSNSKELCYPYYYHKKLKKFTCSGCLYKNKTITAKIIKNGNGEECLLLFGNDHICKPKKFILEEYEPKIMNESAFLITANQYGKPNSKIILFDPEKDGYSFSYFADRGSSFTCTRCKELGKLTRLDLCEKENGEKYVKLGPTPHICKSLKYEKANEFVKSSQFVVIDRDDEIKRTKVILFIDDAKELCYQYSFIKDSKLFQCSACRTLSKQVSAKLVKDKNGEELFQLYKKNAHVCTPKKFVPEEYQRKIIPESGFKLSANKTGKPNSKLVLYDPEKKGYGYIYSISRNTFYCLKCQTMKKTISLRLREKESGEKFVELSNIPHLCKSERI